MFSDYTLLQAAMSHLDLAMMNICEQSQHHELGEDHRAAIGAVAAKLQQLVSQSDLNAQTEEALPDLQPKFKSSLRVEDFATRGLVGVVDMNQASGEMEDMNQASGEMERGKDTSSKAVSFSKEYFVQSGESAASCDIVSTDFDLEDDMCVSAADMLKIAMDLFDEIDCESAPRKKVLAMCQNLGFEGRHIRHVFECVEKTSDGLIYREEWKSIAQSLIQLHSNKQVRHLLMSARSSRTNGTAVSRSESQMLRFSRRRRLIISYKTPGRMLWDAFIVFLLVYVALALPLSFGYDDLTVIDMIDSVVDWIFIADLLLQFVTTFTNDHREEVWDHYKIASRYLKSWFLLDFVSSFPFEQVSRGLFPRMQAAKLLKFGKVAKATKMLRLSKMVKLWAGSELAERLEEAVWSHKLLVASRGMVLLAEVAVVGHWLACLLLASGGEAVDAYIGFEAHGFEKYEVALYWAMMTMTTVGYGDVSMKTNLERGCAIICMIIGGIFYGYIIGVVTTILSQRDMNHRVFAERMEIVVSWLNAHYELAPGLRRRVWRHFKEFLRATKAVEDSIILNDLPPDLCNDVSVALLQDSVRNHPLFAHLSLRALSKLVKSITEVQLQADEEVVNAGDAGQSMFIIDRGFVRWEKDNEIRRLCRGESFGEEMVLCGTKTYEYSVKTHSKVRMFRILRDDFATNFKDLHEDLITVTNNYRMNPEAVGKKRIVGASAGGSSLLAGGPSGMTPAFPDAVLEHLSYMTKKLDHVQSMHVNLETQMNAKLHDMKSRQEAGSLSHPSALRVGGSVGLTKTIDQSDPFAGTLVKTL